MDELPRRMGPHVQTWGLLLGKVGGFAEYTCATLCRVMVAAQGSLRRDNETAPAPRPVPHGLRGGSLAREDQPCETRNGRMAAESRHEAEAARDIAIRFAGGVRNAGGARLHGNVNPRANPSTYGCTTPHNNSRALFAAIRPEVRLSGSVPLTARVGVC